MTERQLESGIWLPERDPDKGFPFVQVILDSPPNVLNIIGPEEVDVASWSDTLWRARQALERGELPEPIRYQDPMYGDWHYIHPDALRHIASVSTSYMPKVAVEAMKRQLDGKPPGGTPSILRAMPADPFANPRRPN